MTQWCWKLSPSTTKTQTLWRRCCWKSCKYSRYSIFSCKMWKQSRLCKRANSAFYCTRIIVQYCCSYTIRGTDLKTPVANLCPFHLQRGTSMIMQPVCWEIFRIIWIYQFYLDQLHLKTRLQAVAAAILIKTWFGMDRSMMRGLQ